MSERRSCRAIAQNRSTQRFRRKEAHDERRLVSEMRSLSRAHPRYGYRRVHALLGRAGWSVNIKRVARLWRREGLQVPQKQRRRRRTGSSANSAQRRAAVRPNHVWTYDFLFDRTEDGRLIKVLNVVDEFTRRFFVILMARRIRAVDVIQTLEVLIARHGTPEHIRSDNGPEFVVRAIRRWLKARRVSTLFIEPGSPWENPYIESFNGRLRDELLDAELFTSLREGQWLAETWRTEYNDARPHSGLDYQTPTEFAASWAAAHPVRSNPLRPKPQRALEPALLT